MNSFPIVLDGSLTTPHEATYGEKPDMRQLFRIFSTIFFSKKEDGNTTRTNVQSHTMQGIAVGWSEKANGMEIYNPITKTLYTSTVYNIDENNSTKNYFNLDYDGGMFTGLYSSGCDTTIHAPHTIGTIVKIPSNTGSSTGFVTTVPATPNANSDPCYGIALTDGTTTQIPSSMMEHFIDNTITEKTINLPTWIKTNAKVRFTENGTCFQGRFSKKKVNGRSMPKINWDNH